jgi:hypothetical protein
MRLTRIRSRVAVDKTLMLPLALLLVVFFSDFSSSFSSSRISSSFVHANSVASLPSRQGILNKKKTTTTTTTSLQLPRRETAWISGVKNFAASGMAAACSKLILAPFDTIKTIQQHSRSSSAGKALSFLQATQVILQRPNGFLEFYVRVSLSMESQSIP